MGCQSVKKRQDRGDGVGVGVEDSWGVEGEDGREMRGEGGYDVVHVGGEVGWESNSVWGLA